MLCVFTVVRMHVVFAVVVLFVVFTALLVHVLTVVVVMQFAVSVALSTVVYIVVHHVVGTVTHLAGVLVDVFDR